MSEAIPAAGALDEETARAELYDLLAQLYYGPPATELFEALTATATQAGAAGALLEKPWRDLLGKAREMPRDAVASEYEALFGGIGKPEIYLFGSHYLSGFLNDRPLAQLRADLARLGLARVEAMSETEDHISYLCEVMRYLITGDDAAVANLMTQREFFAAHLQSWVPAFCDALAAHPLARFYAALAAFTQAFMKVEAQGFDMLA